MGTNTGIGIGIGIPFKNNVLGEGKPYLPPEIKDSLKAVVIAYGKTNNDSDRAIVKNLVDASNPFVISNAAFKLNSGFGKYETELSNTRIWTQSKETTSSPFSSNYNGLSGWIVFANTELTNSADMPSFKIQVKGLLEGQELIYRYYDSNGQSNVYSMGKDGEYTLPADIRTVKPQTSNTSGFQVVKNDTNTITITQVPSFEGAFVTDGIDDLITSTKTVQEMLGGSNEVTVVSMINTITPYRLQLSYTNAFPINRTNTAPLRNEVRNTGKTGIYGYTYKNNVVSVINNVLGDKNDYTAAITGEPQVDDKFEVTRTKFNSSVAWYWTFIAKKALTTDQINQVIAYFNLDRTLKPDILCNIEKQGITNENHAEFGDKLIDFSGNGRDIQLNNLAWDGDSGIGKYNYPNWKVTATIANTYSTIVNYPTVNGTYSINVNGVSELMQSIGLHLEVKYTTSTGIIYNDIKQDGVYSYILPDGATDLTLRFGGIPGIVNEPCNITITQIPSHAGGLCLDGVNDFGKVTGMPIYKDYTVIADYERTDIGNIEVVDTSPVLSKSYTARQGSFIMNFIASTGNSIRSYSFGTENTSNFNDLARQIFYQSKYKNQGFDITAGTGVDGDSLWLGTARDNDSRFFNGAIYSLMSFPYSMSEFLIERQLKKHKLGTLYPDMVEFRPVIKSNASYDNIVFYYKNEKVENGTYLTVGSSIGMHIRLSSSPVNEIKSITVNGIPATFKFHDANNNIYQYDFNLTSKSPQKIDITIDEYIRFEDIVQPYPMFFEFTDENGNLISWGGKAKVGSTITRTKGVRYANLLEGLFTITNPRLNGVPLLNSQHVVEKSMVFTCTATWALDNNEPKSILSPRLLRIPNASYKILGYIPDISGHGNHGVIHNSAYGEGSGVNEDGSYQFDGVDDFVTIPTTVGGKQVLMKVNWDSLNHVLYDQRNNVEAPFCIVAASRTIAYNQRNVGGNTYIDGILNNHILVDDLQAITHNIVLNNDYNVANSNSFIGTNYTKSIYAQMALYDFMLFDDISTDDKIKELNEYVGVEAKVELPPYYWDTYGKTNSDADRDTIQQRGVAVGDYDLINYNHAYEGMSGYNGYPVVFGANKTWEILSSVYSYISDVTSTTIHVTMVKNAGTGLLFSYVKKDGALTNIKEIPAFRVTVKGLEGNSKFGYRYLATEDATKETLVYLGNGTHELAKSFAPTEALLDLTSNAWVGIFITPMVEDEAVFDCDITIEVLPEYKNGLVYDAITDYSKNANIPALDDFTAIIKREWLKKQGCPLIKGSKVYEGGNGNALLLEWDKAYNFVFYKRTDIMEGEVPDNISFITPTNYNGNVITRGSEQDTNGICIAGDGNAGFANMVFYKLILYPKTIPLLQINFLKNLMERDEIIDLNNPIFIKDE